MQLLGNMHGAFSTPGLNSLLSLVDQGWKIGTLRLLHMMNVRFSLLNMAQRILGVTLPNF
jgi:hypothetical protein